MSNHQVAVDFNHLSIFKYIAIMNVINQLHLIDKHGITIAFFISTIKSSTATKLYFTSIFYNLRSFLSEQLYGFALADYGLWT